MYKMQKLAAACVAGGLIAGAAAHAQTTINSNPGDVVVAFEILDQSSSATGGQENLEVDLGSVSSLNALAAAHGGSVALTNFLSVNDLTSTYGANWNTSNNSNGLFWTVFAADGNSNQVWTTDTQAPYSDESNHLENTNGLMSSIYTDLSGVNSTTNSNFAFVTSSTSDGNSFTQDIDNGGAPGNTNWQDSFGDVPGNVLRQTTNSAAFGFYDMQVTPSTQAPATEIGTFSLSNAGVLTYTDLAAVPEPSTWATIILGAASLVLFGRRRRLSA